MADVRRVKARFLVVGTAVAAGFVVPYRELGFGVGLLALLWIVFVAVAFRALDHADGLVGTVGVLTAFGVAACAAVEVLDGLAVLLSVLAAALTGFLMHNWHPARIALGACGSLFTGFVLASAAVVVRTGYELASSAWVLFALTAVAGADVVLVVVSRRLAGRPLSRGVRTISRTGCGGSGSLPAGRPCCSVRGPSGRCWWGCSRTAGGSGSRGCGGWRGWWGWSYWGC